MVHMDLNGSMERDLGIDLESGTNAPIGEEALMMNGFAGCEESTKFEQGCDDGEGNGSPLEKKKVEGEEKTMTKKKKKSAKKPPKPPRPPRAPSMDATDQKLIREMNELAMLKRARVERMRALKRMKNNAKAANTNGYLVPWVITLIFCVVIIWQGFFSRGTPSLRFHGSPESPVRARGGFISVQFYNASAAQGSSSASPNNVEQVSGLDNHGGVSRAAG